MTFAEILPIMLSGKKVTRHCDYWHKKASIVWLDRELDCLMLGYNYTETDSYWNPSLDDLRADDWTVAEIEGQPNCPRCNENSWRVGPTIEGKGDPFETMYCNNCKYITEREA